MAWCSERTFLYESKWACTRSGNCLATSLGGNSLAIDGGEATSLRSEFVCRNETSRRDVKADGGEQRRQRGVAGAIGFSKTLSLLAASVVGKVVFLGNLQNLLHLVVGDWGLGIERIDLLDFFPTFDKNTRVVC
jgi:hypothetical protein